MKLLNLLKTLEKEEYREFEKFLQSPFFKAGDQYLKYYQYLLKQHPSLALDSQDLENAYRRCFGEASFSSSKMYNLLSWLAKHLENFISVKTLLSQPNAELKGMLLVQSLGQRKAGAYFKTRAHATVDEWAGLPIKKTEDYHLLQLLNQEIYFHPTTAKHREHPPYLQSAVEYLDLYYCISKLRYAVVPPRIRTTS